MIVLTTVLFTKFLIESSWLNKSMSTYFIRCLFYTCHSCKICCLVIVHQQNMKALEVHSMFISFCCLKSRVNCINRRHIVDVTTVIIFIFQG